MNAQQTIAANVAARGYRDGWTAEQFVARQLCKLTEELAEAVYHTDCTHTWTRDLWFAGANARKAFDGPYWDRVGTIGPAIQFELADMLVVLLTAAEALEFDVIQAAIDKSAADVSRGVRNGI